MTVFVVNMPSIDTSSVVQYGDIRHINHRYVYPDELDDKHRLPGPVHQRLLNAAINFDPEIDYLLIAGDHLQLVTFAAMLGMHHSTFRVLRWDRQVEAYSMVQIEVPVTTPPIISA